MMFKEVNIHKKLIKERKKTIGNRDIMQWIHDIFDELDKDRSKTYNKLRTSEGLTENTFNLDKIETDKIFHIDQIKKICIDYRLRFLDTKYFKGAYPEEAISKIHQLEKDHNTTLKGFKIIAPSKLFVLKKADDPLLFVPISNNYYYLIHKWGKDLHPLRKYKMWSFKNVGNLAIITSLLSFFLALLFKDFVFNQQAKEVYVLVLFLFIFKFSVGFILLYGISKGKNFNEYIWQSQYDKVQ